MSNRECIFCKFARGKKHLDWENEFFSMKYDDFPVTPGHVIIFPKRHVVNIADLNKEEWTNLKPTIQTIIEEINNTDLKSLYEEKLKNPISDISRWFCQKALNSPRIDTDPDAYNHGINDGTAAGRTIDHLHWHIIPRYEGDMRDPRGGVRYVIPELGNYKLPR